MNMVFAYRVNLAELLNATRTPFPCRRQEVAGAQVWFTSGIRLESARRFEPLFVSIRIAASASIGSPKAKPWAYSQPS
jgi:hypothetical protein